jgi:hypothetical protein
LIAFFKVDFGVDCLANMRAIEGAAVNAQANKSILDEVDAFIGELCMKH